MTSQITHAHSTNIHTLVQNCIHLIHCLPYFLNQYCSFIRLFQQRHYPVANCIYARFIDIFHIQYLIKILHLPLLHLFNSMQKFDRSRPLPSRHLLAFPLSQRFFLFPPQSLSVSPVHHSLRNLNCLLVVSYCRNVM